MDVLIITTQNNLDTIGVKYLHNYLLEQGYDSCLLYLPAYDIRDDIKLEHIQRFISKNSPKLIGMSLMSTEYNDIRHLTRYLKENFKLLPIIWGGIHPTIAPEICLEYADYVCIGEGEIMFSELIGSIVNNRHREIPFIKNLCYKHNGQIKKNDLYPLFDKLDELPLCAPISKNSYIQYHKDILCLDQNIYRKYARYSGIVYSIITSRGCPFSCTYCCNNYISHLYSDKRVRRRSVVSVISELKKAISDTPYIQYVNFQDDCFLSCSSEYLRGFCEVYKKEIDKPFIIRSVPIFITKEKMEYLKSAGLGWISVGLQSGSDYVCKEIYDRKFLKADFLKAANLIKEYNVAAFYDVILDNPFESDDDRIKTIFALIETPKPYYTQFFSLSLYPGTELHERALRECPEHIENYLEKKYQSYKKTLLNDMMRIATFVDETKMKKLVNLFKDNSASFSFKFNFFFLSLFSKMIFEPLAYFRVIALSQGGSYWRALKILRFYLKEGLGRYFKQFHIWTD